MTRELVWTGFITLDGVADSPGGTEEGHPSGGWVLRHEFLPEMFSLKGEEIAETSALMFGRRSYEAFGAVWPGSEDHAAYRNIPKFVVSTTIAEDDLVDGWGGTTVLRSTEEVAAAKHGDGGAIFIHGSPELARRLADAGLIDRYHLLMFPYLLGSGKRPFSDAERDATALRLRESEMYANGVMKLIYDVPR
ncbi:dihydrofolate reductase family protein [Tsukamurella sp. PLM1]|uniref:dihydrofolate reductase family protein n=1 Tax=Tsukamurella sp. PLM1 TaxID=2929795 RepID=UPI0020BD81CD|nr:dihydrofolate reductase family protein [Tsukamurella sp. PLM1]